MKHFILAATLMLATPAFAGGHMATADEIRATIPGNTVQGTMVNGAAYSEYYQADGVVRAAGYTGHWGLVGNKMCFDYGEGVGCWNVKFNGETVVWMNGETTDGIGTLVPGNPNNF